VPRFYATVELTRAALSRGRLCVGQSSAELIREFVPKYTLLGNYREPAPGRSIYKTAERTQEEHI
jgi:hypothetical protein